MEGSLKLETAAGAANAWLALGNRFREIMHDVNASRNEEMA
jgi:hypothetical protein